MLSLLLLFSGSSNVRRRRSANVTNFDDKTKCGSPSSNPVVVGQCKNIHSEVEIFPTELMRSPLTSIKRKSLNNDAGGGGSILLTDDKRKQQNEKSLKLNVRLENGRILPGGSKSDSSYSSQQQKEGTMTVRNHGRTTTANTKSMDVATRAEILAASTLKMISRLDEINKKSKKTQGNTTGKGVFQRLSSLEKQSSPLNSVILNDCKNVCGSSKEKESSPQIENVKIPFSNSSVRNLVSPNRKISSVQSRIKSDVFNNRSSSLLSTSKLNRSTSSARESPKFDDLKPNRKAKVENNYVKPSSILKNKTTQSISKIENKQKEKGKPVSILKRKSFSLDDETHSNSPPPVTFSPSAIKKDCSDSKKQGILKKRRSLDESEVLRKRSNSSDANLTDFKSILKNQRRSSMEELRRRSRSPEAGIPQGILKRKCSKEEEFEDVTTNVGLFVEPQGILKKKLNPIVNSFQPHVKISDNVILAATEGISDIQLTSDNVRPILKKKSSSEEHSTSDLSLAELPKSILKKKSSLEGEDGEEKPKKPILKTSSRIPSLEDAEEFKIRKSLLFSNFDVEPAKPILKRENSRSKMFDFFNGNHDDDDADDDDEISLNIRRLNRPRSLSEATTNHVTDVFVKRRSLEFQPFYVKNFEEEFKKTEVEPLKKTHLKFEDVKNPNLESGDPEVFLRDSESTNREGIDNLHSPPSAADNVLYSDSSDVNQSNFSDSDVGKTVDDPLEQVPDEKR